MRRDDWGRVSRHANPTLFHTVFILCRFQMIFIPVFFRQKVNPTLFHTVFILCRFQMIFILVSFRQGKSDIVPYRINNFVPAFYKQVYTVKPLFQSSQKPVRSSLRTSFCDDWKRGLRLYSGRVYKVNNYIMLQNTVLQEHKTKYFYLNVFK